MDAFMPMSTKIRHNEVVTSLIGEIFSLVKRKSVRMFHEEISLVYWGRRGEPETLSLVEISKLKDVEHFRENVMNELYCAQPDFMVFKQENKWLENKRSTRMAGCPDLIVEIWSDGNSEEDRAFKKFLYSTSARTEHWYIDQDSDGVECFMGERELPAQTLREVLREQGGLEFDLRHMAIGKN